LGRSGRPNRSTTEWYQPLDAGRVFFVAPYAAYANEFINGTDASGEPIRFRLQTMAVGADLGVRLSQVGEFRLGIARALSRTSRRFGDLQDLEGSIDRGWVHADLVYDTMESRSFATRGTYGRVSWMASRRELGADDDYSRVNAEVYRALSFGKNTIVPRFRAGLKVGGDEAPIYDRQSLGGFLELSGLSRGDLYDQNALLAELVYFRKIAELSVLGGSVFLGADTVLGPIHLGLGVAEGGETAVYLHLGAMFPTGQQHRDVR
jgi:NTE family protein